MKSWNPLPLLIAVLITSILLATAPLLADAAPIVRRVSAGYIIGSAAYAVKRTDGVIVAESPAPPAPLAKYDPAKNKAPEQGVLGSSGNSPQLSSRADPVHQANFYFDSRATMQAQWSQTVQGINPIPNPFVKLTFGTSTGGIVPTVGNNSASGFAATSGTIYRLFTPVSPSEPGSYVRADFQMVATRQGLPGQPPQLEAYYKAVWGDNYVTIVWDSEHDKWVRTKRLRLSNGNWAAPSPVVDEFTGALGTQNFVAYAKVEGSVYTVSMAQITNHDDPREGNEEWAGEHQLYDYVARGQSGVDPETSESFDGSVKVTPYVTCIIEPN